ncbi:MAG: hypothetical protein IT371_28695 [Deltaproteobacteria bacterium]|nr:hypothetical protein [Deltaproteobacteria bacterium]
MRNAARSVRSSAVLALGALLLAAWPDAALARGPRLTVLETVGEGISSRVYRVRVDDPALRHLTIAKVVKRYSLTRAPQLAKARVRKYLADDAVATAQVLRGSETFRRRFGQIVPDAVSPRPGVILQEEARGTPYERLAPAQRAVARAEIAEAARMAEELLPGRTASRATVNFLFDRDTGKISAWYDHLSSGDYGQNRLRRLGSGAVSTAWRIGDWVVKIVKPHGMWMPENDAAKRGALAADEVQVMRTLRESPVLRARFGAIFPETYSPRPGVILQRFVKGRRFAELGAREQLSAIQQMHDIYQAASALVPGHTLDAFNGWNDNFAFDARGKVVAWFDVTHPDWIVNWRPGLPLGLGGRGRDDLLGYAANITRKLTSAPTFGHRTGVLHRLLDGFAQAYTANAPDWGTKLLVSNPRTGKACLVQWGFAAKYVSTTEPRSQGRPLYELLGLPLDDQQSDGSGGAYQRFERGELTWTRGREVQVRLDGE